MKSIRETLLAYTPTCEQESADRARMLAMLDSGALSLSRENNDAHFTASGWIVSPDGTQVLMVHHNLWGTWSWTGGHADGCADLFSVAQKEAREETGIPVFGTPVGNTLLSLEILPVFGHEKRGVYVPTHLHCNFTYLLTADPDVPVRHKPDENSAVKWFSRDAALAASNEAWMVERVYKKLIARSLSLLA